MSDLGLSQAELRANLAACMQGEDYQPHGRGIPGTAPHGKLTKAEKKRLKKQRIKGRLMIQEAQARVNTFFNDMLHHGCAVSRVYYDGNGPVEERVDPKDVLK